MEKQHVRSFDDETVQQLFGFEDAESENPERLKEYFLKKDTFNRVVTDLPLRILVGHKGTGKSALFRVAMSEEEEKGNLAILIKPDDIAEIALEQNNFLIRVREWKEGLTKIIGEKVFAEIGVSDKSTLGKLANKGIKLINYLYDSITDFSEKFDISSSQKIAVANFFKE